MMERHNRIVRASIDGTSRALLLASVLWIAVAGFAEHAKAIQQPAAVVLVVSR